MSGIGEYLRDPASAAIVAAAITAGFIHTRSRLNNEGKLKLHQYLRPAILNGVMVYFIISMGVAEQEVISQEPF